MRKNKTERIPINCEPTFVTKVDNYRFDNRIGSRAATIRILIEKGLEASKHETAS